MNDSESADEPPLSNRNRPWATFKALTTLRASRGSGDRQPDTATQASAAISGRTLTNNYSDPARQDGQGRDAEKGAAQDEAIHPSPKSADETGRVVDKTGKGEESSTIAASTPSIGKRFLSDTNRIIRSSWINWLLLFVPIGIAFGIMTKVKGHASPISPNIVFAVNAIAIIPLAWMLCFATESVAAKLGDTWGALLNVTFGNAVELIIFIIALVAGEIRIVQASLLGSILANLLLILGMCFLFGGLRYREQLYNTTVSQMSACLLSLAVISLLLPTAFHASFSSTQIADKVVVKVSRGTSVVLLFVYVLYLLFQLKSHAYMYESTPQHLIDEESHPGVLADMLNSSSSSDTSSSSSDSEGSDSSHHTTKRIRRALRRKRRKSNASSRDTPFVIRTPSSHTKNTSMSEEHPQTESPYEMTSHAPHRLGAVFSGDEADDDGTRANQPRKTSQNSGVTSRDFEPEQNEIKTTPEKRSRKKRFKRSKYYKKRNAEDEKASVHEAGVKAVDSNDMARSGPQVGFVSEAQEIPDATTGRRPFTIRGLSSAVRPAVPRTFPSPVFSLQPLPLAGQSLSLPAGRPTAGRTNTGGVRRTTSLPDIMQRTVSTTPAVPPSAQPLPHLMPANQSTTIVDPDDIVDTSSHLSQVSAIVLLLISTGLVAACAEFLVDSIDYLVENSGISQAFIGLIILPIVGNAAEHVTAVTMASKNKMDLAIGVALGSSIQIALFVTPLIVLIGWGLNDDMSLYFSLFETISLFASAFIVNYLVIDGRSNYLEGVLLMAVYVIIALAAFFYPTCDLSAASGPADTNSSC